MIFSIENRSQVKIILLFDIHEWKSEFRIHSQKANHLGSGFELLNFILIILFIYFETKPLHPFFLFIHSPALVFCPPPTLIYCLSSVALRLHPFLLHYFEPDDTNGIMISIPINPPLVHFHYQSHSSIGTK